MSKKPGPYRLIRRLLAENPQLSHADLIHLTGFPSRTVTSAAWRAKNIERVRQNNTSHRRRRGMRPLAEIHAERRDEAKRLTNPAAKLKRRGASFAEIGTALGITRNAVAGRLWRAKQRSAREGARA